MWKGSVYNMTLKIKKTVKDHENGVRCLCWPGWRWHSPAALLLINAVLYICCSEFRPIPMSPAMHVYMKKILKNIKRIAIACHTQSLEQRNMGKCHYPISFTKCRILGWHIGFEDGLWRYIPPQSSPLSEVHFIQLCIWDGSTSILYNSVTFAQ